MRSRVEKGDVLGWTMSIVHIRGKQPEGTNECNRCCPKLKFGVVKMFYLSIVSNIYGAELQGETEGAGHLPQVQERPGEGVTGYPLQKPVRRGEGSSSP